MTSELNGPSTGSKVELNHTSRHIWVELLGRRLLPLGDGGGGGFSHTDSRMTPQLGSVAKNSGLIWDWSDVDG